MLRCGPRTAECALIAIATVGHSVHRPNYDSACAAFYTPYNCSAFALYMRSHFLPDLLTWAHHSDLSTLPDPMLLKAINVTNASSGENAPTGAHDLGESEAQFQPISFAMSCRIEFTENDPSHMVNPEVRI